MVDAWSRLVDGLTEQQALALRLLYVRRLSYRDIAERMGASEPTVAQLISDAVRKVARNVQRPDTPAPSGTTGSAGPSSVRAPRTRNSGGGCSAAIGDA